MPDTITVCSGCLRASCWQGVFPCDEATAMGTVEKTEEELAALELEHPRWWDIDPVTGCARTAPGAPTTKERPDG
jgi:hypothetical protein